MNNDEFETLRTWMNGTDEFAKRNNLVLLSISEGKAVGEMTADGTFLNSVGLVQGGALFSLADFTGAAAANSYGFVAVSMNSSVNFIRPGEGTMFKAVANVINRGRRTIVYDVDVFDAKERLVLHTTGTSFITENVLPCLSPDEK